MNSLRNNIYLEFVNRYRERIIEIHTELKKKKHEGLILVDFDKYSFSHDFDSSIFACDKKKLPEYAIVKVEKLHENSIVIAIKHVGLCLITEIK